MTLEEWIQEQDRPVPSAFKPCLTHRGIASAPTLLEGARVELLAARGGGTTDRAAAFALLAADAYVTYACAWTLVDGGTADDLRAMVSRIAEGWV